MSRGGGGAEPKAVLVSVQVGRVRSYSRLCGGKVEQWQTAIRKAPVDGPVWLGHSGLEGDEQADRTNHGGPDQAVLAYAASHYPLWQEEWDANELPYGGFGENFTIDGLTEETVCIGDSYRVGDAVLQISHPRGPCWKLERRWERPGLAEAVLRTRRTGWYLRVLEAGHLQAGQPVVRIARPYPKWSVARALAVRHGENVDPVERRELAACELLGRRWRRALDQ